MSRKRTVTTVEHLKCDICGKKEDIDESDWGYVPDFFTRHWSKVHMEQFPEPYNKSKELDLCPTCTRKFKKLVRSIELESEGENEDGNE